MKNIYREYIGVNSFQHQPEQSVHFGCRDGIPEKGVCGTYIGAYARDSVVYYAGAFNMPTSYQ